MIADGLLTALMGNRVFNLDGSSQTTQNRRRVKNVENAQQTSPGSTAGMVGTSATDVGTGLKKPATGRGGRDD